MMDATRTLTLPEFTPDLPGFRAEEFLALTETLLAFPIEQDQARLDAAPFRLDRPEPRPETPLAPLTPRWYPRPDAAVIEAAREWIKPPPRPTVFEGRAGELARLLRPLLSGHPVRVQGEAGAGKTALLATVAAHERTRQRFRRIWWFDQPDRVEQTLALALNLPHVLVEPDAARRRAWLAGHLDDHTLLIVDNLTPDDPLLAQLAGLSDHVLTAVEAAPELPDPDEPPAEDPEGVITLRGLDDTAAIDAFAHWAGLDDIRRLRGQLLRIITALGHHPYALVLAGALVRRDGLTLDDLEAAITLDSDESVPARGPAVEAESEPEPGDDEPDGAESVPEAAAAPAAAEETPLDLLDLLEEQHASLNRAFDVSAAALPRDYRRLFDAFGAFPPSGAPFDGLHAVAGLHNPLTTRRGLLMLAEYAFIRRDHRDPDCFVMHPVAYARAAEADDEHPAQSRLGKKVRAWALRFVRSHAAEPLQLYRAQPGLLHAYATAREHGPAYIAEPLCEAMQPYLREYVPGGGDGDEPPDLTGPRAEAAHLTQVGLELTGQGAYYAAEEALNRALALRETYDSPHAVAETLAALGRLYDAAGRYDEAADRLVKAAELVFALGAEPSLSVLRRGLARVYRHLGRLNDALGVLDDSPDSHAERAAILRAQGNYAAAVEEIDRAADSIPYDRAEIYLLAGRYADALDAIQACDDPASAHLRAQVFHLQGDTARAIEGYRAALDCCGDDTLARARTLRGLGAALASAGQYAEAHAALDDALALYRAQPEPDPARLGQTLRLQAAIFQAEGDAQAVIPVAREALAYLKTAKAATDAAEASRTLARALWQTGDPAGALDAFQAEVDFAQSVPERDDARIGIALHHVADAYRATDLLDRAVANYRLALTHKKPAADPRGYLITQLALHRVLVEAGRLPAALELSQEILEHLGRQPVLDLQAYGWVQALRARTQQRMERPIRAGQSLGEWQSVLATHANEAAADPCPALRVLTLELAARSLLADARPALALDLADQAVHETAAHFPDSPAAWSAIRDLGEAFMALDRPEEAILTLEPVLSEDVRDCPGQRPAYALAHAVAGRAYREIGEPDAALDHLRTAVEYEPDNHLCGLLHETIADVLLDIGQPEAAVESLATALPLLDRAAHPDAVARVLTTRAHALRGLNRYAEAITVYEEALAALREVPDTTAEHTADLLRALGLAHTAQGQLADAARAYRRALNILERADAPRQMRDILHLLARVTAAMGDGSAVQLYEQVREATEQVGTAQELGQVLCELAGVHRDAGRLPLAVHNYQAALSHQPAPPFLHDRINTLRNLGRAYAQMERYDEARDAWNEALALSNDLPDPSPDELGLTHHAIAEAHRVQRQYEQAIDAYRSALDYLSLGTVPRAESLRALGAALHGAGQSPAALEPLQKALDIEKMQPQQSNARIVQTLHLLAETHEECGDLQAAIARYHEALVYMDRHLQPVACADALRILGGLYSEVENYDAAVKAFSEALDIEGDHVPRSEERISATLQAIADTYRAAGNLEKAAEFYQKVTVYANLARRASDDLRSTLDELERRRATLQAAQQSMALLDRNDDADLKDLAFIHALIAHTHARLTQPRESADTIRTLLDTLIERGRDLDTDDPDPDVRALAWLAAAGRAEQDDDIATAQFACGAALESVKNINLHWVIEQVARAFEDDRGAASR